MLCVCVGNLYGKGVYGADVGVRRSCICILFGSFGMLFSCLLDGRVFRFGLGYVLFQLPWRRWYVGCGGGYVWVFQLVGVCFGWCESFLHLQSAVLVRDFVV